MEIIRVGVDVSKHVFQVHGVDRYEQVVWQRSLKRKDWVDEICAKVLPGGEVGMEACAGAHHWARELQSRGYVVKLIAPQFVKPYVKSNKTDRNDAEAICEAMSRPHMRFVALKSTDQQDIQAVHRVRSELVRQRTSKANQIRGLVAEFGLVAPQRITALRRAIPDWLEDLDNGLSGAFRRLLSGLWGDLRTLDDRVAELDAEIGSIARAHPVAQRLQQLNGVGPVIATALLAALGDGSTYRKGRDFAVSVGLTPRQHSTGGRERMLGISKRGDAYLRQLLVHGARAAVRTAARKDDALSGWIQSMQARKHTNVVVVALANKTARMAWAMVREGTDYDPHRAAGCA